MHTQQVQLEEILAQEGWRIVNREAPCSDWWLDEVWTLESVWSPSGRRAYVSFLVDPQASGHRRQGEHVWAVSVGQRRATSWNDEAVPLRPHWERVRRDEVIARLRRLRQEA
jgi:hypothetical protein